MATFFDYIKGKSSGLVDTQIKFADSNVPSVIVGAVEYGKFFMTGTKSNPLSQTIYGSLSLTGNINILGDSNLQSIITTSLKISGDVVFVESNLLLNGSLTLNNYKKTGCATQPIYIDDDGHFQASTKTVGSATQPVYLNQGTITAFNNSIGSATNPIYVNDGTITAFNNSIGSSKNPIYVNDGTLSPISETVGSSSLPIYLNQGTITSIDYSNSVTTWNSNSSSQNITIYAHRDKKLNGNHSLPDDFDCKDNCTWDARLCKFGKFGILTVTVTGDNRCGNNNGIRIRVTKNGFNVVGSVTTAYDSDIVGGSYEYQTWSQDNTDSFDAYLVCVNATSGSVCGVQSVFYLFYR